MLYNYFSGDDHAQKRCARAKISADTNPACRYVDEDEETQAHTIWDCKCWEQDRQPLTTMIAEEQWRFLHPPTHASAG